MDINFESGDILEVPKRRTIIPSDNVYCIKNGYVGLYVGESKSQRLLVIMWAGTTFPLIVEPTPISRLWMSDIHYRTITNTKLSVLPKVVYEQRIRKSSNPEERFVREQRAKSLLLERMINLGMSDVSKRLYMRLLFIASYLSDIRGDVATAKLPLTYLDLAESIGTTRETVNRLMSHLQADGLVSVEKHIITIQSVSKLKELYKKKG